MVSISFIGAPGGLTDKVLIVFLPDTQATAEKSAGITQPNDLQLPGAEIVAEVKKEPKTGVSERKLPCEIRSFQSTSAC